ncbi:MAG: SMC family ATPase [Candidatus Pacearchaeota archaeon]
MRLKKLRIKNIRSYENEEIEFPSDSLLLAGDIGSGKTSILMAIEYALFGLQPGQKGSSLLRNNAQNGEVALELEIDGKEITIERKLRRDGKSVANDYSAITVDGIKYESSVTELKTKVLSLLKYPSEFLKKNNILYRYTVYTPQEQMKQIILEEPETRLNMLGHVFGIDRYKKIRENLSILMNKLKEEVKVLQGEIKTLDQERVHLESAKSFLCMLNEKIKGKEDEIKKSAEKIKVIEIEIKELEKKTKERDIFEKEVEKTKVMIMSKKENLANLSKELEGSLEKLSEGSEIFDEEEFNKIIQKILLTGEEIEKLNTKLIELVGKIKSLEQSKKVQLDKKERIFKIDICPTCLQNVPYAHKHNILNETEREISAISSEIGKLTEERTNLSAQLQAYKSELPVLEQKRTRFEILRSKIEYIEKSKKRIEEVAKLKATLEKDLGFLASHLENLKENILKFSKFSNQLKVKQLELEKARNDERRAEISFAELKKEIEMTEKEIAGIQKSISAKENSKKKLSNILELSDWLSVHFLSLISFIERNVMIKLRIEFEKLFSKWFNMLAGEPFEVHLDENFTPLIIQGETEMDYSFLSGGERTAIALAYRLALNQTINSLLSNIKTKDLIILDEPTEGFSEFQLAKMREVFEELNVSQLIIVSHEQKMEDFVDNVIKLKKESHSSSIEKPVV